MPAMVMFLLAEAIPADISPMGIVGDTMYTELLTLSIVLFMNGLRVFSSLLRVSKSKFWQLLTMGEKDKNAVSVIIQDTFMCA